MAARKKSAKTAKKEYELKPAKTMTGEDAEPLPNQNLPAIFSGQDEDSPDLKGFQQLGLPPLIKPREMPDGAFFVATLENVQPSPIKEYKSDIMTFRKDEETVFAFPATAVIAKAFGDDPKKYVGREVFIKKIGSKPVKGRKQPAHLFDVRVKALKK